MVETNSEVRLDVVSTDMLPQSLYVGAHFSFRTIKHEYVNQVWIGNFSEFEKLSEVIKPHYNECRPHQSFDNKTPAEVRIAVTGDKRETSEKIEKWDTFFRTILGRLGTAIS